MDIDIIKNKVKILIQNSINELEVESPKFDFKRKWYNLKEKFEINEFVKDTTAIVNTVGLDGFIIIGFDDKEKKYHPAKFTDCGLNDPADLQNLIIKKCSDLFEVNSHDFEIYGNQISVIHIPPFKFKPVVIPNYETQTRKGVLKKIEHRIFVRKNARTFPANKMDLDKMYYDRKNVEIEFEYYIDFLEAQKHSQSFGQDIRNLRKYNRVNLEFIIENLGRRTLAIKQAAFLIKTNKGELNLQASRKFNELNVSRKLNSIIAVVKPQNNVTLKLVFSEDESQRVILKEDISEQTLILTLSNGKKIMKYSEDIDIYIE